MRLKLILNNVFIFSLILFAVLYFLRGQRADPASVVSDPYTPHQYSVKGAQIFAALQVCKSPASFQARISQLRRSDGRVASYLARTRPLSLAFSRLTSMSDKEALSSHSSSKNYSAAPGSLIYNRINKCGSSTLLTLLSGVMFKNNVAMALQGSPTHRYFIGGQKLRFADLACGGAGSRPALISRYFFYTDISQYGCVPRYFTVMRDPLDRFHSRYRFNREILPKLQNQLMIRQARGRSKNINDCVIYNHTECKYSGTLERWHKQFEMDSQLPFLCGDTTLCRTMGHPEAVVTTIANIEAHYVVVGVLEMLEETITVMECLMPDIMAGLGEVFRHSKVHKKGTHAAMPAAVMTQETKGIMKKRLDPEYQVYDFAKARLLRQYKDCLNKY